MFDKNVLELDLETEALRICATLKDITFKDLRRKGLVVGVSGGIDSSTCVGSRGPRAGAQAGLAILMPERDSASRQLGSGAHGLRGRRASSTIVEEIEPDPRAARAATSAGTRPSARSSPSTTRARSRRSCCPRLVDSDADHLFCVVVQAPRRARCKKARLPLKAYLQVVAATNFKQRTRKMMEYYHADRLNYAVVGTPNRLEYDQGFFVKGGDGRRTSSPSRTSTRPRSTPWRATWACPSRWSTASPPPTPTAWSRARTSSTSPCPTTRWTCCSTPTTTTCRRPRPAPPLGLTEEQVELGLQGHPGQAAHHALPAPAAGADREAPALAGVPAIWTE